MKPAKINGKFSATNPSNGELYNFDLNEMGWLSTTGYFHWSNKRKAPVYARKRAHELFLNNFTFIKGTVE